jgi:hypothetical protein
MKKIKPSQILYSDEWLGNLTLSSKVNAAKPGNDQDHCCFTKKRPAAGIAAAAQLLWHPSVRCFYYFCFVSLHCTAPEGDVWNGLFWTIQIFVCVNAVAKSFLQESRARMLYFYTIAGAKEFYYS